MAVTVVVKASGQMFKGKFAEVRGERVALYAGIVPDGKRGFRGCGEKSVFQAGEVEVLAHRRDIEVREPGPHSEPRP